MVDSREWGAAASGGLVRVIDAAGDGPAQVAGEGLPRRQPLSPITLTGGLKRLGVGRASMILRPFAAGVSDKVEAVETRLQPFTWTLSVSPRSRWGEFQYY